MCGEGGRAKGSSSKGSKKRSRETVLAELVMPFQWSWNAKQTKTLAKGLLLALRGCNLPALLPAADQQRWACFLWVSWEVLSARNLRA